MNTQERIERFKELWREYKYLEDALGFLQDEIPEGEFLPDWAGTVEEGHDRWMFHMLEVVQIDKDVYVGVRWERGKTERQENMYDDDDVYHVDKEIVEITDWKVKQRL